MAIKDRTLLLFGSSSPKGTGADLLIAKPPVNATAGAHLTGLNYYELCVNNLAADPTLFIRDSADVVRSFKDQTYIDGLFNLLKGGTLPTTVGYRSLSEVSNTLLTFLTGATNADATINRWKELETFLGSISDSGTTLISMMNGKVNTTDYATAAAFGIVKIGTNIGVSGGVISVATANGATLGLVKAGANISIASGAVSVLEDATHRFITDAERTAWNAKLDKTIFDSIFEITDNAGVKTLHIKGNAYIDGGLSALGDNTIGGGAGAGIDYEALQTLLTGAVNAYAINTAFLGNIDAAYITGKLGTTYESNYGNPTGNGYLLSSTIAGVRSWVAPYAHPASGVVAGTYRSVSVNANGHVTGGTNPTTLGGYGITDAPPSSHVGATGAAHGIATAAVHGFMSSTDKSKLDGIAANANNYVHPTTDGNKHIPSGGAAGEMLIWSAAGTAAWTGVISCGTY